MAMKRKPHQANLNPQAPGRRVTPDDLARGSSQFQKSQLAAMEAEGLTPGGAPNAPVADAALATGPAFSQEPGVDPRAAGAPQAAPQAAQAAAPPPSGPEPSIPATYQPSLPIAEVEQKHPLLAELETAFGIEKLKVASVEVAGYVWTFRPMDHEAYEWMSSNLMRNPETGETGEPSLSVANVASTLAAINEVPLYKVFNLNVVGRHIPDPMNPPGDIKWVAARYVLEWLRSKVGMWELVGKLDEQIDILFEEQRSHSYPLWQELAHPLRRQLVEMREMLKASSTEPDGRTGDAASPSQASSPQTSVPTNSGTTPEPPSSSSTGMTG